MSIEAIMSKKVVVTTADASLASLRTVFTEAHFQHVPVVDSMQRVIGIVSVKDFYKALSPVADSASAQTAQLFENNRKVRSIMTSPVVCISPDTTVIAAATLLVERNISCLLVTNPQQKLLGIVSWKDILRLIVQRQQFKRRKQEEEE
ncbi:CBS domain-containing protein [Rheinheimera texasensis]|jgi:acetoin utilization protein AcuB|uniref:CBS domain-containing protein n=1 Tax=Rheinheimera texasensis TaxID=306205 RepID=UPI0004E1CEC4|nr:CBS domain-containing protein [Rheinheimera texasensis]